jgi:uncharacterized repeat protein (TIGR03843 family)
MDTVDSSIIDKLAAVEKVEQFANASNTVFLLSFPDDSQMVFKPGMGERPLWDFEAGTLWQREYLAAQIYGLMDVFVPKSYLITESVLGSGLLMEYVNFDDSDIAAILPLSDTPGEGWIQSISGVTRTNEEVVLWHKNLKELRAIALVDAVTNNADRKVGHIGLMEHGFVAFDHGLTFHSEPKLRTFLWGWQGEKFSESEIFKLENMREVLNNYDFKDLITEEEIDALYSRIENLLDTSVFPMLPEDRPALPWPVF